MKAFRDRPVVQGLLAMAVVTLVIAGGVGLGAYVLAGAIAPGDGSGDTATSGGARPSMYLPEPSESRKDGPGPLISPGVQPRQKPRKPKTGGGSKSDSKDKSITLKVSPKKAASMQEITLQGTYPGADGAILSIEKLQGGGSWISFVGVTTRVSGGKFSTTIQTGVLGENKFRAVDTDSDTTSNEVTVTIG